MAQNRWIITVALLVAALSAMCSLASSQTNSPDQAARVKHDEETCISSLRVINTAEGTFWGGDSAKGYARTLKELVPAGVQMIDSELSMEKRSGYRFKLIPERVPRGRPIKHYTVIARPTKRLAKNQRSFFTDETNVIRFTTENRSARITDPPLNQ